MRMGLFYLGSSVGQDLGINRGVAKPYRGLFVPKMAVDYILLASFQPTPSFSSRVDIRGLTTPEEKEGVS